jgi:outer membrane lipoprotein SlyB
MAAVDTGNNPNDPNNPNNVPGAVNQPGAQVNQPATTGGGAGPVTATGAGNVTGQVVGTANPSPASSPNR